MEFLYTHKWDEQYSGVTFIAHNTSDTFSKEDKVVAIESHNRYLFSVNRLIVNVREAQCYHNVDGKLVSFQEWLRNHEFDGQRLFVGVEVAPNDVVRLIYEVDNEQKAMEAKRNLYMETKDFFGESVADMMLNKSKFESATKIHAKQVEYASMLRKRVLDNPQAPSEDDTTAPPSTKKTIVLLWILL